MFTSRAEYRLQLREDNADLRLTEDGRRLGLVDDARWDAFCRKRDAVSRETERLKSTWVNPRIVSAAEAAAGAGQRHRARVQPGRPAAPARTSATKPCVSLEGGRWKSAPMFHVKHWASSYAPVVEQIEIAAKYSGYIERQKDEVERAAHYENLKLPAELDYMQVPALSIEVRQKLSKHRPGNAGPGLAHLGRDPGGDLAVAGPSEEEQVQGLHRSGEPGGAGGGMRIELPLPLRGGQGWAVGALPGPRARALSRRAGERGCPGRTPTLPQRGREQDHDSRNPAELELRDSCGLQLDWTCRAQLRQLLAYLDLIAKWNKVYNLTAVRTRRDAGPAPVRQPGGGRAAAPADRRALDPLAGCGLRGRAAGRGDRHLLPGGPGRLRRHGRQEGGLHPASGGPAAAAQPARACTTGWKTWPAPTT